MHIANLCILPWNIFFLYYPRSFFLRTTIEFLLGYYYQILFGYYHESLGITINLWVVGWRYFFILSSSFYSETPNFSLDITVVSFFGYSHRIFLWILPFISFFGYYHRIFIWILPYNFIVYYQYQISVFAIYTFLGTINEFFFWHYLVWELVPLNFFFH